MKLFLTFLVTIFTFYFLSAQEEVTYFDSNWHLTKKKNASYFRVIEIKNNIYQVNDYFLDSTLQMSGAYSDSELKTREGQFIYFDELGQEKQIAYYKSGKKNGVQTYFYKNGNVRSEIDYLNGKREGEYFEYFDNGDLKTSAFFIEDNPRGEAKRFYKNHQLAFELKINNKGTGEAFSYYDTGELKTLGHFKEGLKEGGWEDYNIQGDLLTKVVYTNHSEELKRISHYKKTLSSTTNHTYNPPLDEIYRFFIDPYYFGDECINFPDKGANFPGGTIAMQKYIAKSVIYPIRAIEMNIESRVYVSFIVEKNGKIKHIEIEKGHLYFYKETKRLLNKMPRWEAGEMNGKRIRTRCRLPINFTLN